MSLARSMRTRVLRVKIVTIAALLATWEATSRSGLLFEGVVPSTAAIAIALAGEVADWSFYRDLWATLLASTLGFLVGSLIAIAMGIALGVSSFLRRMVEPAILAIGGTPKVVFLPILFLLFGLGLESKIAKSALSTFFPVVVSTTSGFLQIPTILIRVGKSFDLSGWQMVARIYIPAMSRPLMTGLRLGMAMAIIGVLSAEIAYSDRGLGFRLIRNADQFKIAAVYAIAVLIFTMAATINFAFTRLEVWFARHERGRDRDQATSIGLPRR